MTYDAGYPCCEEYTRLTKELIQLRKEFEISRKACQMFERAANDWMDRALKAEVKNAN